MARHEVPLHHRAQQSPSYGWIVERRLQIVHLQQPERPVAILDFDLNFTGALQQRQKVHRRQFPPIHFACLHRAGRGSVIRAGEPLDPLKMHDFPAGGPTGADLWPGVIAFEPGIDRTRAGEPFIRLEAERPAADHFSHRFERIAFRQPFRHHRAHRRRNLAERVGQHLERLFQPEADCAIIDGGEFVRARHQQSANPVACGPPADRCDAVTGKDLVAVVPQQALTQPQVPDFSVRLDREAFKHLRFDMGLAIHPEQRVEHHEAMVAGGVDRGDDGIQDRKVGLRDEFQCRRRGAS